jgi:hypothetical protein
VKLNIDVKVTFNSKSKVHEINTIKEKDMARNNVTKSLPFNTLGTPTPVSTSFPKRFAKIS